jgi:hypothetical protein
MALLPAWLAPAPDDGADDDEDATATTEPGPARVEEPV